MTSIASIRDCLLQFIHSEAPQGHFAAIYVFGSYARGAEREKSDIDMAFLVDREAYRNDAFEATVPAHMIAGRIAMKLDRVVDVTILNSSSLEIAYEVVTCGKCLFELYPEFRLEYELKIKGMYFDFQPFIAELRAKRIAELGSKRTRA